MIYAAIAGENFEMADRTAAARLRSGDPEALSEVVTHYQHRLYRYLARLVRDTASAEDLFQQTWLQVMGQLSRYDSARSFDTWLFAIAHNLAMDALRKRSGERLEDYEFELPDRQSNALAAVLAGERAATVAAALTGLPPLYREALTLRFEEGLKLEEIAEVTGAPLSTVKSRVQRGLEAMRRRLSKDLLS